MIEITFKDCKNVTTCPLFWHHYLNAKRFHYWDIRLPERQAIYETIYSWFVVMAAIVLKSNIFFFFGVHPLRMTTTSSSTLKTQHEEEESMC